LFLDFLANASPSAPTTLHLSLHDGDPAGTGANEASGGSYARQTVALSARSSGAATLSDATETFTAVPAGTYSYFGLWDHASDTSAAHFIMGGPISPPVTVSAGGTVTVGAGDITIRINYTPS
jgi:hypothetical protein